MSENIYREYANAAAGGGADHDIAPQAIPLHPPPSPHDPERRDLCAVGSALCGATGFIPILTQLIGLALALVAIVRIRRARRFGRAPRGMRHAVTGLVLNGVTLVVWIVVFVGLSTVGYSLSHSVSQLSKLAAPH